MTTHTVEDIYGTTILTKEVVDALLNRSLQPNRFLRLYDKIRRPHYWQ